MKENNPQTDVCYRDEKERMTVLETLFKKDGRIPAGSVALEIFKVAIMKEIFAGVMPNFSMHLSVLRRNSGTG